LVADSSLPLVGILVVGGGVSHDVGAEARERVVDDRRVGDRALDQREPLVLGQVVPPRGRKIVDHEDLVAPPE